MSSTVESSVTGLVDPLDLAIRAVMAAKHPTLTADHAAVLLEALVAAVSRCRRPLRELQLVEQFKGAGPQLRR